MEPEGSLPCSQAPSTVCYPESCESSPIACLQFVFHGGLLIFCCLKGQHFSKF